MNNIRSIEDWDYERLLAQNTVVTAANAYVICLFLKFAYLCGVP